MRLVACLTMCLTAILANAAQSNAQAPSDPQAYCVNRNADFYPYTGEPCKSGYQLGSGNCRKADGNWAAVPREQCGAMAGTVQELKTKWSVPRQEFAQNEVVMAGAIAGTEIVTKILIYYFHERAWALIHWRRRERPL